MKLMVDASIPARDTSIKAGGDGIQVLIEIPEIQAHLLPELMKFKNEVFKLVFLSEEELRDAVDINNQAQAGEEGQGTLSQVCD